MDDRAAQNRRHRTTRDRALILLIAGIILLLPPFAHVASIDSKIGPLPITLVYLFTIWAGLILGCALLSRTLSDGEARPPGDGDGDGK